MDLLLDFYDDILESPLLRKMLLKFKNSPNYHGDMKSKYKKAKPNKILYKRYLSQAAHFGVFSSPTKNDN